MTKLTKKSTREEIIKVLIETRASVKKDFIYYDRLLRDTTLPKFRKENSEAEYNRLLELIEDIEVFS